MKYDAILLLGLKLNDDDRPREEMLSRAARAAELWKNGVAPFIVACGGATGSGSLTEAEVLRAALGGAGVDRDAVILEDKSMITAENIRNARQILGDRQRRVALVTSDYHAFRAALMARFAGFRVRSFPAATPSGREKRTKQKLELLYTGEYLLSLLGTDSRLYRFLRSRGENAVDRVNRNT